MSTMSPETLQSMSAAAGMKLSPEQATAMADQMKGMSPESMAKLMAVTTFFAKQAARAKAAKEWAARNSALVAVVVVALLALLVRWYLARRAAVVPAPVAAVAAPPRAGAGFAHNAAADVDEMDF